MKKFINLKVILESDVLFVTNTYKNLLFKKITTKNKEKDELGINDLIHFIV